MNKDIVEEFPWLDPKLGAARISEEDKFELIYFFSRHESSLRSSLATQIEGLKENKIPTEGSDQVFYKIIGWNDALSEVLSIIKNSK